MTETNPGELVQVIAYEFVVAAPPDWATGTITYIRVGRTAETRVRAYDADGSSLGATSSRTMRRALKQLRHLMARPDKGTWFTATCRLSAPGAFTFDFEYDAEPAFEPQIDPRHYLEEWELHPRDPEYTPPWLSERLAQARALVEHG